MEFDRLITAWHRSNEMSRRLDDIPGVGPTTRKILIRRFGSVRGVRLATLEELTQAIGPAKAAVVREHLGETNAPPSTN